MTQALNYGNTAAGPNPQLCVLYYRLAALLGLPLHLVFVFDDQRALNSSAVLVYSLAAINLHPNSASSFITLGITAIQYVLTR